MPTRTPTPAPDEAAWKGRLLRAKQTLGRRWPSLLETIAVYAASRLVTLVAALTVMFIRPGLHLIDVLSRTWDAALYVEAVRHGYPHAGPITAPNTHNAVAGFFPVYPATISLTSRVFGLPIEWAGVLVALVAGGIAVVVVTAIAERLFDASVARRTAVLFSFAPGAVILSMTYSEGVMLVCSAGCLLFLLQRRWLLAGLAAGLATATRPNAIVLVLCCAVAALEAVLRRRDWRALIAPTLAPVGALAYFAFLYERTGSATYWFDVEKIFWHDHLDPGTHLWSGIVKFVQDPLQSPVVFLFGVSVVAAVALAVILLRASLPIELKIFGFGILAIAAASHVLYPNPRFIFTAFPVTIALAAKVRGSTYGVVLAASAAAMALLLILYAYGSVSLSTAPVGYFPAP